MNVLVTGGAGYIGSHVCKVLKRNGFFPIVYDNLSTGHAYAVKWGPLILGDLADRHNIRETCIRYRPQAVFHFAANALVGESVLHPAKYYRNNTSNSLILLEEICEAKIPYFIFSGTCAVYGNPQFLPLTEEHPLAPINPYGWSKRMIEQMLKDFDAAYGLRFVALRYFNAAGADLEQEIGENHDPETHLLPSILQAALQLREEIVVYGTDFATTDGSAIRDYVHVCDLAEAHLLALRMLLEGEKSRVFNLGTGKGTSVWEMIHAVQKYVSKKIPVRIAERRAGDPSSLVASADLASTMLGWNPKYSDLETLIRSAWKWHEKL
jgi:UDP-arabinose 4-epimerase